MSAANHPPIRLLRILSLLLIILTAEFPFFAAADRIVWTGAVTENSFAIRIEAKKDEKFVITKESSFSDLNLALPPYTIKSEDVTYSDSALSLVKLNITGLVADTAYNYGVVPVGGSTDKAEKVGTVQTFPTPGAATNFTFGIASCAKWQDKANAYEKLLEREDMRFFINPGDLFYGDIVENNRDLYVEEYLSVLQAKVQRKFFAKLPMFYIYDDHDFAGNDADGNSPSKPASLWAFDTFYAHPEFRTVSSDNVGFQAFTVGRVRFVITDLRSQAKPEQKTSLGNDQLAWLFEELEGFNKWRMMIWVSSKPWSGPNSTDADQWRGFPEERARIANKISELGINNLIMVAGDAHMLAIDDGSNTDFSTNSGSGAGFPLLHSAPLSQFGSVKGGPYSVGCHGFLYYPNYHYSTVNIIDSPSNTSTCFTFNSYTTASSDPVLTFSKCRTPDKPSWVVKRDLTATPIQNCSLPWFPGWIWAVIVCGGLVFVVLLIAGVWFTGKRFGFWGKKKAVDRSGSLEFQSDLKLEGIASLGQS